MANLHLEVTRRLARRVMEAGEPVSFPKEAELALELGVSRTILRESMKVLVDKGMITMRPRAGTRSTARGCWRRLDPDILAWQAETRPDAALLRDLCEVRLAIEPTAAGFAAVRASEAELLSIEAAADSAEPPIERDLAFHRALVVASHNPLLEELSATIGPPLRTCFGMTARLRTASELSVAAHKAVVAALRRRDPLAARRASEEAVGIAMLAVEEVIAKEKRTRHATRRR